MMKKLVSLPIMLVGLFIPFLCESIVWGLEAQSLIASGSCIKPIGRVIKSLKSRQICEADEIEVNDNALVICYSNQKFINLQSGLYKAASICTSPETSTRRRCTPINRQDCPNRKGPGEDDNVPSIIQPYGHILIENRPLISWSAVAGATSYSVQVRNGDMRWEKEVEGTTLTLAYPEDQPGLLYGTAIRIVVMANKGKEPISYDSLVVHLLREEKVTQINQAVEQIKKLGLSADEAAYLDLDAIYMSKRILNKTIETLEERVAAGSFNPSVYRILGDRYIEAWLPEKAKSAYIKALQLARFQKNSEEVTLAQERLLALSQSQLPTRINPAQ